MDRLERISLEMKTQVALHLNRRGEKIKYYVDNCFNLLVYFGFTKNKQKEVLQLHTFNLF